MGQEYFINSQELENKIRQLLPSQGGAGAGFDLSASTQIIPVIDVTESAEGSDLRADLQSSFSHGSITSFAVTAGSGTLITNTGYFRVFGNSTILSSSGSRDNQFTISDGASAKTIWQSVIAGSAAVQHISENFDFLVFLEAGDSFIANAADSSALFGCTRQIASIDKVLTNP